HLHGLRPHVIERAGRVTVGTAPEPGVRTPGCVEPGGRADPSRTYVAGSAVAPGPGRSPTMSMTTLFELGTQTTDARVTLAGVPIASFPAATPVSVMLRQVPLPKHPGAPRLFGGTRLRRSGPCVARSVSPDPSPPGAAQTVPAG